MKFNCLIKTFRGFKINSKWQSNLKKNIFEDFPLLNHGEFYYSFKNGFSKNNFLFHFVLTKKYGKIIL